jgi:hypothetical protein
MGGLWKFIQGQIGDLKSMVVDTIQSFLIEKVIVSGITWILSLLNPASAFVRACKAIIDIIRFFIERASQIAELINAVIEAVTAIASGSIGGAAKAIENALSKSLPVVISFMASLLGIGGISDKVQEVIKRVRQPIEKAINWVIEQAVKFAKKLGLGKDKKNKDGKPDERTEQEKKVDLHKAVVESEKIMEEKDATPERVKAKLPAIQSRYKLTSIELIKDVDNKYYVDAKINPEEKTKKRDLAAVERIEELVKGAEPAVAAQIIASVKAAQESQQKAKEVHKILTNRNFVRPTLKLQKTVAVSGNTVTVSGWNSLTPRMKEAVAQRLGMSLDQDTQKVREYYEQHKDEFKQFGYEPEEHPFDPKAKPDQDKESGKYYTSHAEKQASVIAPSTSIGVSKSVCEEDCYPYLHALAQVRKQNIAVADPDGVWVFYSNGSVKFLYNKQ